MGSCYDPCRVQRQITSGWIHSLTAGDWSDRFSESPASTGHSDLVARAMLSHTKDRMGHWLTVEVQHRAISASVWRRVHAERLIGAAVTNGALTWQWQTPGWGVVLELEFTDEAARDRFRLLPAVTAPLDAVPDPVAGVVVYTGWGGGSGAGRAPPTPSCPFRRSGSSG